MRYGIWRLLSVTGLVGWLAWGCKTPGAPQSDLNVIQGAPVKEGSHPETVFLALHDYPSFCTGAVIGHNAVLTAAHCVSRNQSPGAIAAISGDLVERKAEYTGNWSAVPGVRSQTVWIAKAVREIHNIPWLKQPHDLDLAVVQFPDDSFQDTYVLGTQKLKDGETVEIVGYGLTSYRPGASTLSEFSKRMGTSKMKSHGNGVYLFRGAASEWARFQRQDPETKEFVTNVAAGPGDSGGPLLSAADESQRPRRLYGTSVGVVTDALENVSNTNIYTDLLSAETTRLLRQAVEGGADIRGLSP